jgi:hypothetical protein
MEIAVQSGTVRRSHGVFGFHAVVVADARASHGDGRAKKGNGNHNGKQLPCASENGLAYRDHISARTLFLSSNTMRHGCKACIDPDQMGFRVRLRKTAGG